MGELEGSLLHRELMVKSAEYLQKQGCTTFFSTTLYPTRYRTDVLGLKDSEIIGVECGDGLDEQTIEYKTKHILPHLTKMIFAIPSSWIGHIPKLNKSEVLRIDTKNKSKNQKRTVGRPNFDHVKITVSVKAETRKKLEQMAGSKRKMGKTLDHIVQAKLSKAKKKGEPKT